MMPAPFRVVLDANVLYPFTLRDTLLRAAAADFFQVSWSEWILDEATRNLVRDSVMEEKQAARLRTAMANAFPEALVSNFEPLIAGMKNQEKDRHVAAAAVKVGAQVIVTINLNDFRELPDGLEAQHPDEFLSNLFDLDADALTAIVQEQASALKNPPRTFEEILVALERLVPEFARAVRQHAASKEPSPR